MPVRKNGDKCSNCGIYERSVSVSGKTYSWCKNCLNRESAENRGPLKPETIRYRRLKELNLCTKCESESRYGKSSFGRNCINENAKNRYPSQLRLTGVDGRSSSNPGLCTNCKTNPRVNKAGGKRASYAWCNPCMAARVRAYRYTEKGRISHINAHIKAKYGEDAVPIYWKFVKEQGESCAICGQGPTGSKESRLSLDHDHNTGTLRGLLCKNCNLGLGGFRDNTEWLRKAISYLEKAK